jgi:hypothetical protein
VQKHSRCTARSFSFSPVQKILYRVQPIANSQFNHLNDIKLIARAHQLVQEGFKYMFEESLVTVWSAPNYCYRCGNSASIMRIQEDGTPLFKVYDAAKENESDNKNPTLRRMVRLFVWTYRLRSGFSGHIGLS